VRGLTAMPIWQVKDLPKAYRNKIQEVQDNWQKVE
jgi:hypothetical protein